MRISRFLQTPFISYEDKNMLYFEVADWDMCNLIFVSVVPGTVQTACPLCLHMVKSFIVRKDIRFR